MYTKNFIVLVQHVVGNAGSKYIKVFILFDTAVLRNMDDLYVHNETIKSL